MGRFASRKLLWPPREFDRTAATCISSSSRNSNDILRDARLSVRPSVSPYTIYIVFESFIYGFFYLISFFFSRHPPSPPYTLSVEDTAVRGRRWRRWRRREHSHVLCKRDEIYPGLISITKIPLVVPSVYVIWLGLAVPPISHQGFYC